MDDRNDTLSLEQDPAAERDPLAELRSLADTEETQAVPPPEEPPVGVSETARQLENDGFFAGLEEERAREKKITENKAFLESRKSQLKKELETAFGPQTPAVEEPTFGGEFGREVGRVMAGQIPKLGGSFLRQIAGSLSDPSKDPDDPNDPNYALAKALRETGQSWTAFGERNLRGVPAPAVEDMTKISRDSISSFAKDSSLWLGSKMGQAVGFGGPMLAGGMVLGLPGIAATSLPMGIGEVRESLEQEGISDEALIQSYAWHAGVAIGALDAIVPYDILTEPVKRGLSKYMLVRMAKTAAQIGAEEALTEAMQEAVQIAAVAEAKGLHVGEDRQSEAIYNMGRELFEKRWEIAEAGASGFVGGVTLGSGKIAASAQPVREAKARTGGTKTDVIPVPAVEQPEEKKEEAPKDSYDVKQFYPAEEFGRETEAQADTAERPSSSEEGAALRGASRLPVGVSLETTEPNDEESDAFSIKLDGVEIGALGIVDHGANASVRGIEIEDAHRGRGIGPAVYDEIERLIGKPLVPDAHLSDSAYRLWKRRNPEAVRDYRRAPGDGTEIAWVRSPSSATRPAALRDVPLEDKVAGVKDDLPPTRIAAMAVKAARSGAQMPKEAVDYIVSTNPELAAKLGLIKDAKVAPVAPKEAVQEVEAWQDLLAEAAVEPDRAPRKITTPDGSMEVDAEPTVVEMDTLRLASGEFQPRDRSRAESEAGVRERAANLDPERLQPGRVSDGGAPIVSEDGTIISGNGRVMSIAEVYRDPALKAQADAYRASLGPEAEGMRQPVLISRLPAGMQRADLVKFADLSNRPAVAGMSATEKATRDARAAGAGIMGLYQGGSFTAPQNAEFFRAFTNQAVSSAERGTISRNGVLTKEGEDRMAAAVLAAAYGDSELLSRMLESTDDNIRSITGAMRDAAGAFIRLKEAIRRGEVDPRFDITPQITDAAKRIADLRERNIRPDVFLNQQDAFTQTHPLVESLIRAFYNDNFSRALGREKVTEILTSYAEEAAKHRSNGFIPDETTAEEVVEFARGKALEIDRLSERLKRSQGNLFGGGQQAQAAQPAGGVTGRADAGSGRAGGRPGAPSGGAAARPAGQRQQPETKQAQASPAERDYQRALRARFRSIIASKRPAKEWGAALRLKKAADLKVLVDEAVREGLLRVDKNGVVRRTKLARVEPKATPMRPAEDVVAIPPDLRVAEAIRRKGISIPDDVRAWAVNIEEARGRPQQFGEQMRFMRESAKDGELSLADLRMLALIVGYDHVYQNGKKIPLSKMSKAGAIAAIKARHDDMVKGQKAQADRRNLGVELASIMGAREDGQEQKRELDKLGFYSKALEAAKALKQAKGTPEQMLAQLKSAGVKEAEIKATGLDKFLGRETEAQAASAKRPSSPDAFVNAIKSGDIPVSGRIVLRWNAPQMWLDILEDGKPIGRTFVTVVDKKINADPSGTDFILGPLVDEAKRRQGIANSIYDAMEALGRQHGMTLVPGAMRSKEADALWAKRKTKAPSNAEEGRSAGAARKSVSRQEIISFLTQNRVEVRESIYGDMPYDELKAARTKALRNQRTFEQWNENAFRDAWVKEHGLTGESKWASYSLDPSNPTYRETVIHLPGQEGALKTLEDEIYRLGNGPLDLVLPSGQTARERMRAIETEKAALRATVFRQGHFSEPNVIAHARTSLQKDADGKAVFVIDELQSDWGQKLRDGGARDEAKIAELRKRSIEALAVTDAAFNEATAFLAAHSDVTVEAFERAKGRGMNLGGPLTQLQHVENFGPIELRDSAAALRERMGRAKEASRLVDAELATAEAATPGHPLVNTTDQWTTTAFRRLIRQAVEAGAERIAIVPGQVQNERPGISQVQKVDGLRYVPAAKALQFKRADGRWERVRGAEGDDVTPDRLTGLTSKELAEKLLAAAPTAIEGGHTAHVLDNLNGAEIGGHGMVATYDGIYPRTLGKLLSKIDPAIKQEEVSLQSSLDGRMFTPEGSKSRLNQEYANSLLRQNDGIASLAASQASRLLERAKSDAERATLEGARELLLGQKIPDAILFHSFPLTAKVKETVLGEGLALFSIQSQRSSEGEEGIGLGRETSRQVAPGGRPSSPAYTPAFRSALPQIGSAIEAELARMVPQDVATRVVDRLTDETGIVADELVTNPRMSQRRGDGFRWMLQVAMSDADTMRAKGRHGVVHILRELGLWTDSEWKILRERAEKVGIRKAMEDDILTINKEKKSLWQLYEEMYAKYSNRTSEYMDQELVARLAEQNSRGTSFGSTVDALLDRIAQFFEALRNAVRGLGFQTADDIFAAMASGEIAARAGRREPAFTVADAKTGVPIAIQAYRGVRDVGGGRSPDGIAFWTDDRGLADLYTRRFIGPDAAVIPGATVLDRVLGLRNPLVVESASLKVMDAIQRAGEMLGVPGAMSATHHNAEGDVVSGPTASPLGIFDAARAAGHDSIILKSPIDTGAGPNSSQIIQLDAEGRMPVDLVDTSHAQILSSPEGMEAMRSMGLMSISAYHGSRHDFDRFELSKLRTGQGLNMYGAGHYFAGVEATGRHYQMLFSDRRFIMRMLGKARTANFYKVRIDTTQDRLIDADALVSQQPEAVQKVFRDLILPMDWGPAERRKADYENMTGYDMYRVAAEAVTGWPRRGFFREVIGTAPDFEAGFDQASRLFAQYGIDGLQFFDAFSRGKKTGTRNFVIFRDDIITITEKNDKPVNAADQAVVLDAMRSETNVQTELASISSAPQTESFPISLPGYEGSVTTKDKGDGNRVKSYKVFGRESEASAAPIGRPSSPDGVRVSISTMRSGPRKTTQRLVAESEFGKVQGDLEEATKTISDPTSRVRDDAQGQGHGVALYQAFADRAAEMGYTIKSANPVTGQAARVYEALKRRGYDVVRHAKAVEEGTTRQGAPLVVTVHGEKVSEDHPYTIRPTKRAEGLPTAAQATAPSRPQSSFILSEQPDGAWELSFFNAEKDALSILSDIESDLGNRIGPSGWLTPEGYAAWKKIAPEKVKDHQDAGALFQGMYASPKALQLAMAVLREANTERPIRAAIRYKGEVFVGLHHGDAMGHVFDKYGDDPGLERALDDPSVAGYVTTFGRYVSREQAAELLREAGDTPALVKGLGRGWVDSYEVNRLNGVESGKISPREAWQTGNIPKPAALPLYAQKLSHLQSLLSNVQGGESPLLLASIKGSGEGRVEPRLEGGGPSIDYSGDPRGAGGGSTPRGLAAIIADLKQALRMPVTQGLTGLTVSNPDTGRSWRVSPRSNVRGQYQTPQGVARIRLSTDIDAIAHEGGHHLEAVIGQPLQQIIVAHAAELSPYAGNVASVANPMDEGWLSEGFAEWFREYVLNPDKARTSAPAFNDAFEDLLDAERPDVLEDLEKVQIATISQDYKDYVNATAVERGIADVATWSEPTTWEKIKTFYRTGDKGEVLRQWLSTMSFSFTDKANPILKTQQRLLQLADANGVRDADGRPISLRPGEDAYRIARLMARSDKIGHQMILNGVPEYNGLEGIGPSLHDAIAEAMGGASRFSWTEEKLKRFGLYLEARRAVVEWSRFLNGELERRPTRKSAEEYMHIIDDLEQANPSYKRAAQMVYDFQHRLLTLEWQAGKWTDDQYAALSERRNYYVPFQRDLSDIAPLPGAPPGSRLAGRFTEDKKFKGSDRAIVNPLEAIAKRVYHTAAAIQFNDMVKALTALSDRVGIGGGGFIERVAREEVLANNERTFERIKQAAIASGMDEADAHILVSQMHMNFDDAQVHLLWDPDNLGPARPPIVPLFENGERKLVRLNDPVMGRRLFEAMNALGREQTNILITALSYPAAVLRAGVTMHPAFVLSNIMGDMMAAYTLTGSVTNPMTYPVVTQVRGLYHLLSTNRTLKAGLQSVGITPSTISEIYSRVGGISGGQNVAALRAIRSDFRLRELSSKGYQIVNLPAIGGLTTTVAGAAAGGLVGGVIGATAGAAAGAMVGRIVFGEGAERAFAQLSELSETITRLGVASHSLKRAKRLNPTLSDIDAIREAAFTASDVLDFERSGAKAGTVLKLIPFFGSNIQGVSKAYRQGLALDGERGRDNMGKAGMFLRYALTRTGGARQELSPRDQQAIADGMRMWVNMGILAAAGAALFLMFKDDPEFEDVGEEIKSTHFVFKLWGTWYRMKKPFELATPANITQSVMEWWIGKDPRLWSKIRDGLIATHAPPYLPQTIRIYSDLKSGIDTRNNRPIIRQSLQRLPPYMQFDAYSSEFAIQWAKALHKVGVNVSPAYIDYALNNSMAYWGREVGVSSNYFFGRNREAPKWTDVPIAGTIVNRVTLDPSRRSASVEEFWKIMGQGKGKFDRASAGYDHLLASGNGAAVQAYLAGLEEPERIYAVLDKHFKPGDKIAHPLKRAMSINAIDNTMRREMILGELIDTTSKSQPEAIALSPAKKRDIHDILGRLSALETWNAMHDIGIEGWGQRQSRPPALVLDELRAASPAVYDELMRRRAKAKVGDYADDLEKWNDVKERVQELIKDEDMLGLAWQKTVRKRRSPTPPLQMPAPSPFVMPGPAAIQ